MKDFPSKKQLQANAKLHGANITQKVHRGQKVKGNYESKFKDLELTVEDDAHGPRFEYEIMRGNTTLEYENDVLLREIKYYWYWMVWEKTIGLIK